MSTRRTTVLFPLLALLATVLTLTLAALPAGAHSDEGELTMTGLEQTGPTTIAIQVGIVYEGDGHLAEDAQVSATLTGPDGSTVGPVQMTRTGDTTSLYAASVEVPVTGDWRVTVTSEEPAGEVEGTVTLAEQTATTTTAASPTTAAPTTVEAAPEPVTLGDEAADDEDGAEDEADSGVSPAVIVAACVVLAALVIGGAFLVARSRSAKDDEPTA